MPPLPDTGDARLADALLRYASEVDAIDDPYEVIDSLHQVTCEAMDLCMMLAIKLPRPWADWSSVVQGKTVFVHDSVPKGWWEGYVAHSQENPGPSMMLAYLTFAPFTLTEILRTFEPKGTDRGALELSHRLGIRDTFACPIGGQWLVVFWSRNVLVPKLTPARRALALMGATSAAIRLQKITTDLSDHAGMIASLTARENTVLRLLSMGRRIKEIAEYLELGEETVRSHTKKAQAKLGVSTLSHAVAQAIRLQLIS